MKCERDSSNFDFEDRNATVVYTGCGKIADNNDSLQIINCNVDDRDMLVRKSNFVKYRSISTPQNSQRRAAAAKYFHDFEYVPEKRS